MKRFLSLWLALSFLLVAGSTKATTGGPDALELLGYDPADGKLYFLHPSGGESDGVELEYVLLQGPSIGRRIVAKSWSGSYVGDPKLEARLAQLKARLVPLRPDTRSFTLTEKRVKRVRHVTTPGDPPWKGWEVALTVRVGKRKASKRVTLYRGKSRIVSAWRVPTRGSLVLVEYVGIPYEFGYETQEAIWVPDP